MTAKIEAMISRSNSKLESILRILYVRGPKFAIQSCCETPFGVEMRCLPVSVPSDCMDLGPRKFSNDRVSRALVGETEVAGYPHISAI